MRVDPKGLADAQNMNQALYDSNDLEKMGVIQPDNEYECVLLFGKEELPDEKRKTLRWSLKLGITVPGGQHGREFYGWWWPRVSEAATGLWANMLMTLDPSLADPNHPPVDVTPNTYRGKRFRVRVGVWESDNGPRLQITKFMQSAQQGQRRQQPPQGPPPQQQYQQQGPPQGYAPQPQYQQGPPAQQPQWQQPPQGPPPGYGQPSRQPARQPRQQPSYAPPGQQQWGPPQGPPPGQWNQPPQAGPGPVQQGMGVGADDIPF